MNRANRVTNYDEWWHYRDPKSKWVTTDQITDSWLLCGMSVMPQFLNPEHQTHSGSGRNWVRVSDPEWRVCIFSAIIHSDIPCFQEGAKEPGTSLGLGLLGVLYCVQYRILNDLKASSGNAHRKQQHRPTNRDYYIDTSRSRRECKACFERRKPTRQPQNLVVGFDGVILFRRLITSDFIPKHPTNMTHQLLRLRNAPTNMQNLLYFIILVIVALAASSVSICFSVATSTFGSTSSCENINEAAAMEQSLTMMVIGDTVQRECTLGVWDYTINDIHLCIHLLGTGKTCLVNTFTEKKEIEKPKSTIGFDMIASCVGPDNMLSRSSHMHICGFCF